ncbi:MAG: peptidase M23 [Deltaproteobacteria bacterium]|nr:MAG: peptidase M23 [Deltaproteobacteria bacterium]PIE74934.1 MAG: peptidase M23 [Deltaproteobacteria bacterium]
MEDIVARKSRLSRKQSRKLSGKFSVLLLLIVVLLLTAGWIFLFEGKKPEASLAGVPSSIGKNTSINIEVSDEGRGLKDIYLYLYKDKREILLDKQVFQSEGFLKGSGKLKYNISLEINPEELGIKDGTANIRLVARDFSWRSFFKGNQFYAQKDVLIDTTPPKITVLSRKHYVAPGGAGLVCYKISELDSKSGVIAGGEFFPGYSGITKDPHYKIAFFALEHRKKNKPIYIEAVDKAGNIRKAGFNYYIRKKHYKNDKINISDNFLSWKMPEFNVEGEENLKLVDKFLVVNNKIRKENTEKIISFAKKSEKKKLWEGSFMQMPGSAKKAGFAEHRSYYYKGRKIDEAYHMGLDLASVSNADIPAANSGKVVYSDRIGIYGLTIIIDHGFGLLSIYSHLSLSDVKDGDIVKKGEIIGKTGTSGFAGGDHLHFGIFINNRFVEPIEWLDGKWIKNNITSKLDLISSGK